MSTPVRTAAPHTKATRDDWFAASLEELREHGVDHVRVQPLAARLGVARASFYWYFADHQQLLAALRDHWVATNTASLVQRAQRYAPTIAAAVLGVFECWADVRLFDPPLDTAMRDWARNDPEVAAAIAEADASRVVAMREMFTAQGFRSKEASVRARVLYYNQVGYYAVGMQETDAEHAASVAEYVHTLTGRRATRAELAAFTRFLANR